MKIAAEYPVNAGGESVDCLWFKTTKVQLCMKIADWATLDEEKYAVIGRFLMVQAAKISEFGSFDSADI